MRETFVGELVSHCWLPGNGGEDVSSGALQTERKESGVCGRKEASLMTSAPRCLVHEKGGTNLCVPKVGAQDWGSPSWGQWGTVHWVGWEWG